MFQTTVVGGSGGASSTAASSSASSTAELASDGNNVVSLSPMGLLSCVIGVVLGGFIMG